MSNHQSAEEPPFQPLSKEELQLKAKSMVEALRTTTGEEYIAEVGNLWASEDEIRTCIQLGEAGRQLGYQKALNRTPGWDMIEKFQIRHLVFYSLTDPELRKILETIPEYHARENGFMDLEHKITLTEEILIRYLELCKYHNECTFWEVSWNKLVSPENQYSVLKYNGYNALDGGFTKEAVSYYRADLMGYNFDQLQRVIVGLTEGEQNLIEHMHIEDHREQES